MSGADKFAVPATLSRAEAFFGGALVVLVWCPTPRWGERLSWESSARWMRPPTAEEAAQVERLIDGVADGLLAEALLVANALGLFASPTSDAVDAPATEGAGLVH